MRFIKKLILISISLFAISVSADTPKNTLVIAQRIDEIITLDPAAMFEFAAMEYANNTYNTLVSYDLDNV
ncbi:MAG: ABC transporter substrate-binding protein, partial [Francisellaceae bacterium]|nr:ABC transporter substrate-binding protein [Francisellaceae bacterium]